MARAVHDYNVTPADELRALLAESEKLAGQPAAGPQVVYALLENLDRIAQLWPQLEAAGLDLRPEDGRRRTLEAQIHRLGPRILRHTGAAGMRAERERRFGSDSAAAPWWWRLDEEVVANRNRTLLRAGAVLAGLAVIAFLAVTIFNRLFPVDPAVRESASAQLQGQQKAADGDYAGALAEFQRAVQATPNDGEAQMWWGVAQERGGDQAGAAQAFATARTLLPNQTEFYLTRAPMYYTYHMFAKSQADIDAVLAIDPQEPRAYFYRASILEDENRFEEASAALELAAQYADERGDAELVGIARYRIGILMQRMPFAPTPTAGTGE